MSHLSSGVPGGGEGEECQYLPHFKTLCSMNVLCLSCPSEWAEGWWMGTWAESKRSLSLAGRNQWLSQSEGWVEREEEEC